ncbi:DUF3152 domain-containing protein [Streptomyces griseofuscus]|uniref:DUF3152 domain-containing protein n=1 Tax=Streptomyces griseofuscus TaxID=146922 RepID=A0A7H1PQW7_9ACTN|nr:hypothetical protein HEP81_00110 [Streptomyces griseofuscus]
MHASHRAERRRPSRRRRRPCRRGRGWPVAALTVVGLLGSAAVLLDGRSDASSGAPRQRSAVSAPPEAQTQSKTNNTAKRKTAPPPSPSPTDTGTEVPSKGTGVFVTARAGGAKVGRGPRPLRYVVKTETGLDLSPAQAADEIAGILAAPRGWSHNPAYAFQLVGAGQPHDLTVSIATPGTADALCWAGIHQDTGGEYNCEVPGGVVVNLKRWVEGSPTFDGPIHDYRALIINHEMGHFLGYTHTTCAGPGRLAPVMMQQIKGLHGCVANAWPYDRNGAFVSGPKSP